MPFLPPTAAGERDVLKAFALQQIGQVRTTLHGLTTEQVHRRTTASELSLAMLARHIRNACLAWGGAAVAAPARPSTGAEVLAGNDDAWAMAGTETPDDLRAGLDEASAFFASVVEDADLDAIVPTPEAPWFHADLAGWQARWVVVHIIAEVARHAGHADIIRESLDGKTSYELNARADGELADDEEFPTWG